MKKQMFAWAASIRVDNVADTRRLLTGADCHTVTTSGETPVMFAAYYGAMTCLNWLLENGFDVRAHSVAGITALHYGAQVDHDRVCRTLISHGANPNALDGRGNTPLAIWARSYSTVFKRYYDTAKVLVDAGAIYSGLKDPILQRRLAWNQRAIALRNVLYASRRRFPRDLRMTLMKAFYALRWQ